MRKGSPAARPPGPARGMIKARGSFLSPVDTVFGLCRGLRHVPRLGTRQQTLRQSFVTVDTSCLVLRTANISTQCVTGDDAAPFDLSRGAACDASV